MSDLVLGIDVGTSGVRVAAVDRAGDVAAFATSTMPAPLRDGSRITQDPAIWARALDDAMARLGSAADLSRVGALAVDGTSGTLVAIDERGRPVAAASLYNDSADEAAIAAVGRVAPHRAAVHGATSPLARAARLQREAGVVRVIHQADWIAGQFSGRFDISDETNALKTGYDPVVRAWPDWIENAGVALGKLPTVVPVGSVTGEVTTEASRRFGVPIRAVVVAGVTDGCAAFLATGADRPGAAVTSLGSTLVLKLASEQPLFAPEYGLYSHRIGDMWLAGGASNTGGVVLTRFFAPDAIREISGRINPGIPTGFDYYPLSAPGERFPINDPALSPRMTPRPADDAVFLQALLEGIAKIEALGYRRLAELGGPRLTSVATVGGGAANESWSRIRAAALGVPLRIPASDEAAVGVARLALSVIGVRSQP
jgi:sugar (pentulose or hexulose) kinase